jgi:membrane fusion protein, cation efflux system
MNYTKKSKPLIEAVLVTILLFSAQKACFSHVGHGDEFQSTGGIERVEVKPETDQMLGITVTPIDKASSDGVGVMIPITSLVDADGKQLVFVQYENYYEPVEVTTGVTEGDYIQVTKELSVGEKLVTQGSLSLYAESRKTQNTEETATTEEITAPVTEETHAQADAQGIPHNHDSSGNLVKSEGGFPLLKVVAIAGGVSVLLGGVGAAFLLGGKGNKKKKIKR